MATSLEKALREMRMVRGSDPRAFFPNISMQTLEHWIDLLERMQAQLDHQPETPAS